MHRWTAPRDLDLDRIGFIDEAVHEIGDQFAQRFRDLDRGVHQGVLVLR